MLSKLDVPQLFFKSVLPGGAKLGSDIKAFAGTAVVSAGLFFTLLYVENKKEELALIDQQAKLIHLNKLEQDLRKKELAEEMDEVTLALEVAHQQTAALIANDSSAEPAPSGQIAPTDPQRLDERLAELHQANASLLESHALLLALEDERRNIGNEQTRDCRL